MDGIIIQQDAVYKTEKGTPRDRFFESRTGVRQTA